MNDTNRELLSKSTPQKLQHRYEQLRKLWCERKQLTKENETIIKSGVYAWMIAWKPYENTVDTNHTRVTKMESIPGGAEAISPDIPMNGYVNILAGMILTLIKEEVL